MAMILNAWLRTFFPRPDAALRLVFFPHAGGSASYYRPLAGSLPGHIEPVIVQYPGHEDRLDEEPYVAMEELADALTPALHPLADKPLWFFGHSMGASVAYEVTRRLIVQGGPRPAHLIVSARPGPARQRPGCKHLDDDQLWADVCNLGGTDARLPAMPELRAILLPTIRADYRLIETYRAGLNADLDVPLTACFGDCDPEVTREDAETWRAVTIGPFGLQCFPGDHFYLRNGSEHAVVDWLAECTSTQQA